VCPVATTTYTVTVTDAIGNIATADVTVEILPLPQLDFTVTDVLCNGGSDGTATVIPSVATPPFTHVWNTTPPQATATAVGLSIGTYTVTTTDDNGCTSSADVSLNEPVELTVSFTTTPANCGEADGSATADPAGGTGPYTFAWDTAPVQSTATATGIVAGPRSVTVTDANGCTVTGIAVVPSIGGADLSSSFTDATCNGFADGTATVLAANGTEPYSYSWNTAPAQNTATATGLVAGSYTVTVTEGNGCSGFVEVIISEPTAVLPEVTTIPGSCGLPNGTATATASGGVGPYSFLWDTDPAQTDATATGLIAGIYTVTVTDAAGCIGSVAGEVINVPGPVAGFVGEDVCLGSATTFQNTSVNGSTWEWDMGDGTLYPQENIQHTYLADGQYTVTLTVTDLSGCSDTFSGQVRVDPVPVAAFVGDPLQGCAPLVTAFQNTGSSVGPTCVWDFWDGNTSTDCVAPSHTYANAGCYDVTLTVTEFGCSSSSTIPQMVCVDPVPAADFSIDPNPALVTSPFVLYSDRTIGASSFEWLFTGGSPETSDVPIVSVDYTGQEPGLYDVCLFVTNDAGCADTLCRILILRDELRVHVPNSFTPDGDGVNDMFIPVLTGHGDDKYLFSIYNRWGELIFETQDPTVGWDGTMPGTLAQDGVYVWRLRVNAIVGAEIQEFTGHVTLVR
jgi:gliding motility-associated-like protein